MFNIFSVIIASRDVVIGTVLGRGASGSIFRGQYQSRPCAVKQFHGDDESLVGDAAATDFCREANLMLSLRHRNIVAAYGVAMLGDEHSTPSLIMEMCEGGDLFMRLQRALPGSMSFEVQRAVALDVARGVAYLHALRPPLGNAIYERQTSF